MRESSLADLARSAFVLITVFVVTKADRANEACSATQVSRNDYKGRFFANRHINSSASFLNQSAVPTVFGCRSLCETHEGCIALSFSPPPATKDNCMLYNLTNIQKYLSPHVTSAVILLLPMECKENSTVDGGWSSWESENGCVECLTSRKCRQRRKCDSPESQCNGSPCAGNNERILDFTPCTDLTRICNVKEEDIYTFQLSGTSIDSLVTVSPNESATISIQRRFDGSVEFVRVWNDYKSGFGNLSGEFWLGNDNIHLLTSQQEVGLKIELGDFNETRSASYSSFSISSENDNYRLSLGSFVGGDAGNSFGGNGGMFTTTDRDNDVHLTINCAAHFQSGGWWFTKCHSGNLNGLYSPGYPGYARGIIWVKFRGIYYSLPKSEMKIQTCDG